MQLSQAPHCDSSWVDEGGWSNSLDGVSDSSHTLVAIVHTHGHTPSIPTDLHMSVLPELDSPSSRFATAEQPAEPTGTHELDEAFEAAVLASDQSIRASHKRTREAHCKTLHVLKKPKGAAYPFHDPVDVLNCCMQAAAAVAGCTAPDFDLGSDPRQVYMWMAKTMIDYGNECREEGSRLERDASEPRLQPHLAGPMLKCVMKMTELLSTGRT